MEKDKHIIDATNRILGRLAVEIAMLLRGKNEVGFAPNKDAEVFVTIKNADKIIVTGKKFKNKIYYRHTGYLGGLKKTSYKKLFKENPGEVIKKAVYGMLPKNKLRDKQIKRLKFE